MNINGILRVGKMLLLPRATAKLAAPAVIHRGRWKTRDVAFQFRMGAGFAGDINRTHPFSDMARMPDATNPPSLYGIPVIIMSTGAVRMLTSADQAATDVDGVSVRPFPIQPNTAASPYGAAGLSTNSTPPTNQPLDYLISGFIMVPVVGSPSPKGAVYVWTAAASGAHVTGGFEAVDPSTSGMHITQDRVYWNSQADSNGIAELAFNV